MEKQITKGAIEMTRFFMHYTIPAILFAIAIILAIFVPYKFYYVNGQFRIIIALVTIIPLWITLTYIAIIISKSWIIYLRSKQIIK